MKHIILLALVLTVYQAQAETYTCYFGNPFAEITYNTNSQTLKMSETVSVQTTTGILRNEKISAISNIRLQELANGDLGFISGDGQTLITMKRTNSGSDGVTNFIYPFSAQASIDTNTQGTGACETNSLRAEKPEAPSIEE